jgi:hypothetical protein
VPNRTLLACSINVVHTGSQKFVAISIVARWRQAFGSIDAIRHNADKGSGSNGPTGPKCSPLIGPALRAPADAAGRSFSSRTDALSV